MEHPMEPDRASTCGLCGHHAGRGACGDDHRLCHRCHNAYWRGHEAGMAAGLAAAVAGVSDSAPAALCPAGPCFLALAPPGDLPPPGHSALVRVKKETPEYARATTRFLATIAIDAVVERVFRVENPALADMFELCRARMAREMKPTEAATMFHGSSRTAVGSIARSGFDIRYSGSNAEALGPGIYFAENAKYSHGFAVEDYGGNLCMIVAHVLAGRRPEKGRTACKRGARQREGAGYYDSNFGGGILAVRREQQALPLFVIYYS